LPRTNTEPSPFQFLREGNLESMADSLIHNQLKSKSFMKTGEGITISDHINPNWDHPDFSDSLNNNKKEEISFKK